MKTRASLLFLVAFSAVSTACSGPLFEPPGEDAPVAQVQSTVELALKSSERVRVFIQLHKPFASTFGLSQNTISATQKAVLNAVGDGFLPIHRYRSIPYLAGELSPQGLVLLRNHPAVKSIRIDPQGKGALLEAVPAIGADQVQSIRGLSGAGVRVAVLDSGVSTSHPALEGAIVAQHCFVQNACPPSNTSESASAEDDHGHGSNVTGIVASRGLGGAGKGFAPGAEIVAVKVLNSENSGWISDWVAGFDWVYDNLATLNVKVINASLVTTNQYEDTASCDAGVPALSAVIKQLTEAGVTIFASSGNGGSVTKMGAPACNTGVIAVGATYDSDLGRQPSSGTYQTLFNVNWPDCYDATSSTKHIACFTSTAGDRLDLLAPGAQIQSVGLGSGTSTYRGTSQASPAAAGVAALMLECNPSLTPAEILQHLKTTGEAVNDPRSDSEYPLIRAEQAIEAACDTADGGAGGAGGAASEDGGAAGAAPGGTGGVGAMGTGGSGATVGTGGSGATGSGGSDGLSGGTGGGAVSGTGGFDAGSSTDAGSIGRAPNAPEGHCSCTLPGNASGHRFAGSLAVLGLGWLARRRRSARAAQTRRR